TIPANRDPELVVLSPDGKVAYVSNEEIAHASAIDIASGKTLFSTSVGVEPEGLGITRDGTKLYGTAEANNTVSVLDAKTGRLVKTLHVRSEEHTSELQSPCNLVCRLLLEKKKKN